MKIFFISSKYPPYYDGGYELKAYDVARELCKKGHDIYVLTSIYGVNKNSVDGNVYRVLNFNDMAGNNIKNYFKLFKSVFFDFNNYFITKKLLKRINPDIVYIWHSNYISISPAIAAGVLGIPAVFHLEDYWLLGLKNSGSSFQNYFLRSLCKIISRFFFGILKLKNIIVVSNTLKRKYMEIGIQEEKIKLIKSGISTNTFSKTTKKEFGDKIRLLYTGRLSEEKGVNIAIEAVNYLIKGNQKNIILDIVGRGSNDYEKIIKEKVHYHGIENYINFLGMIERELLPEIYCSHDILLVPSIWEEPFGLSAIEGMACGIVVIASNVGALSETIVNGENGILVNPNDFKELSHWIVRVIRDKELYESMQEKGIEIIKEKYTIQKHADSIEEYLKDICRGYNNIPFHKLSE